jgi:hypothetical protein
VKVGFRACSAKSGRSAIDPEAVIATDGNPTAGLSVEKQSFEPSALL